MCVVGIQLRKHHLCFYGQGLGANCTNNNPRFYLSGGLVGVFKKCPVLLFFEEKVLPTISLDYVVCCYLGLL